MGENWQKGAAVSGATVMQVCASVCLLGCLEDG